MNQPTQGTVAGALAAQKPQASEAFRFVAARHDKVLDYQFGLARWMLASLLFVNGGALLGVLNAADKRPEAIGASVWFVAGVVCALLCGTIAWLNCNLVTIAADHRLDWATLGVQVSPTAERLERSAWILGLLAVLAGLASLVAFPIGAMRLQHSVSANAKQTSSGPTFTDEQIRVLEKAGIAKSAVAAH